MITEKDLIAKSEHSDKTLIQATTAEQSFNGDDFQFTPCIVLEADYANLSYSQAGQDAIRAKNAPEVATLLQRFQRFQRLNFKLLSTNKNIGHLLFSALILIHGFTNLYWILMCLFVALIEIYFIKTIS
ncbi:hypothetical protein AADZ86_06935 [Colwelliaceae bacterium BS250]